MVINCMVEIQVFSGGVIISLSTESSDVNVPQSFTSPLKVLALTENFPLAKDLAAL